jgi:hypothetical protein
MPRNMSFAKTTEQVRAGTKTVTRRIGWWFLKPGEIVNAVEKCRGLKKGEKVKHIRQIRIVSTRSEPINAMMLDTLYGLEEMSKEGFANHDKLRWPVQFVEFFCAMNKCEASTEVNRIEFEYI